MLNSLNDKQKSFIRHGSWDFYDTTEVCFPRLGQKLFTSDGYWESMSYFGNSKDPEEQFYKYAAGYKEAADELVSLATKKGIPSRYVYPIIFLYRQFLELALKDIYLAYSDDSDELKSKEIESQSHNLMKIWNKIKPLINDENPANIKAVGSYLSQFTKADAGSFKYRYPIDKKLNLVHEKEIRINLLTLAERIDELATYLDCVSTALYELRRAELEMIHYGF